MSNYVPIIGLEVHAELSTESKLFCRCPNTSNELNTRPNTAVCPVCLGLPGALPVMNKKAVISTVRLGESLGSTIPEHTKWDRKNYFYPDLPKGYQISQYDEPICQGGELTWFNPKNGAALSVKLTRIHLEEDTGKLTHPEGSNYSLIDYNRSSVPLLELVTEPVITSAEMAKDFCQEYQRHLRELGVAEASMEKGQMRCEANISIVPREYADDPTKRLSGTKVEIKNLNSFRSLERAIDYEVSRQERLIEAGGSVKQETRGWNETKGETYSMRTKETADDYRYFPEPDLGQLDVSQIERKEAGSKLTRSTFYDRLIAEQLNPSDITISMNDPVRLAFWESLFQAQLDPVLYKLALQWINQEPTITKFTSDEIKEALLGLQSHTINPAAFKQAMLEASPGDLMRLIQVIKADQNVGNLAEVVQKVLADYPSEVAGYKNGKQQLFGFFVGEVRKSLDGKGDPVEIASELKRQLDELF